MKTGFLKHFYKDLDNLPNSVKEDIAEIIENVEKVNSIREITGVKKLTGYKNAGNNPINKSSNKISNCN